MIFSKWASIILLKNENLKIIKLHPAPSVLDKGLWMYVSFQRLVKAFGQDECELRVFLIEDGRVYV